MSKKIIIFVDDSQNVLDGLRRMLRKMRAVWEMHFFQSSLEALAFLEKSYADVVVSDMKMPVMDGAAFLKLVSDKFPHIIRIILSGQADKEEIFRSIIPSHRYLTKPCDSEQLKSVINQAFRLKDSLASASLQKVITGIKKLPSLPQIYFELIETINNENINLKKVVEIIQKDVSISAQLLKLTNSSYFGFSRPISQLSQAVSFLGLDIIKSLVLCTSIFEQAKEENLKPIEKIWEKSWRKGHLAKEIAEFAGVNNDTINESFTAGLLHACGELVLSINFPQQYEEYSTLAESERDCVFGTSQELIGASLLSTWGLPDSIIESIAFHNDPAITVNHQFSSLSALHLANTISLSEEGKYFLKESKIKYDYLNQLQIPNDIESLLALIRDELIEGDE